MQYTVSINQKAIAELNKTLEMDLNLKHGAIIDFFVKVKNKPDFQTKIINGEEYVWLAYNKILEELPLLKIKNKNVLARYFEDLVKAKILKKEVVKEEGNKTFWRQDCNLSYLLFSGEVSTKKSEGIYSKVERVSTKKSYNHITIDQFTKKSIDTPSKNLNQKIKKILEIGNVQTPFDFKIYTVIEDKIPPNHQEGYLDYLINVKSKTTNFLDHSNKEIAYKDWWYSDYLGFLNTQPKPLNGIEKENKEARNNRNLVFIPKNSSQEIIDRLTKNAEINGLKTYFEK